MSLYLSVDADASKSLLVNGEKQLRERWSSLQCSLPLIVYALHRFQPHDLLSRTWVKSVDPTFRSVIFLSTALGTL